MVHYPVEFPFDSAREIVRIFKAGTVVTEKASVGECVWNLQGYAQRMILGETDQPTIYKATPPASDEEIIAALEEFDKGAVVDGVRAFHFPFDPTKLLEWCLRIAAQLL